MSTFGTRVGSSRDDCAPEYESADELAPLSGEPGGQAKVSQIFQAGTMSPSPGARKRFASSPCWRV